MAKKLDSKEENATTWERKGRVKYEETEHEMEIKIDKNIKIGKKTLEFE